MEVEERRNAREKADLVIGYMESLYGEGASVNVSRENLTLRDAIADALVEHERSVANT